MIIYILYDWEKDQPLLASYNVQELYEHVTKSPYNIVWRGYNEDCCIDLDVGYENSIESDNLLYLINKCKVI